MAIIRYPWLDDNSEGVTGFIDVKTSGNGVPTKDNIDKSEVVNWSLGYQGRGVSKANGDELNLRSQTFNNNMLATKNGLFLAGVGSQWEVTRYEGRKAPMGQPYFSIEKIGFGDSYVKYRCVEGVTGPNPANVLFEHVYPMVNFGRYQFGDWVQIGANPFVLSNDDNSDSTPAPPSPDSTQDDIAELKSVVRQLNLIVNRMS